METFLSPVLLFLIFVSCMYYVLNPLITGKAVRANGEQTNRLKVLELRKVSLYKQLRDVEFEREMGLVEAEDFARARADLMSEVEAVMHEIEGKPSGTNVHTQMPIEGGIMLICAECDSSSEPGARFCSSCGEKLAMNCPQCGSITSPDDHFCATCGRGLKN